jgi:hypothetical protein
VILKPGLRLRSAVCSTEVIVVRASDAELDLRCGGHPMLRFDVERSDDEHTLLSGFDRGSLLGKRYAASGLEILCTKAGTGSISIGDEPLPTMEPRKLPSSD